MDVEYPNRERMWEVFEQDRLARSLGIELLDWGPGWARAAWTPGPEHENFGGTIHGGSLFTLGDVVDRGFAGQCKLHGRGRGAPAGDVAAHERSRTRRTGSYHLDVHAGDRHVASLHAMAHRTSTWHLGEDAWPEAWRSLA